MRMGYQCVAMYLLVESAGLVIDLNGFWVNVVPSQTLLLLKGALIKSELPRCREAPPKSIAPTE